MKAIEGPSFVWRGIHTTTSLTREALTVVSASTYTKAIATAEVLIGKNNLQPIAFLAQGLQVARAVGQVIVPGEGLGTGFLIGASVLMTNNHVLPSVEVARRAQLRLNYETDLEGKLMPSYYYPINPNNLFLTHEKLDFTIVSVDNNPGARWGIIPLSSNLIPNIGDNVVLIQHPGGAPKQIALVDNEISYIDNSITQYLTDSLPGSSGSPVFDQQWRLVAIHHSGGWIPEPSTQSTHFRNEGILMATIINQLQSLGIVS